MYIWVNTGLITEYKKICDYFHQKQLSTLSRTFPWQLFFHPYQAENECLRYIFCAHLISSVMSSSNKATKHESYQLFTRTNAEFPYSYNQCCNLHPLCQLCTNICRWFGKYRSHMNRFCSGGSSLLSYTSSPVSPSNSSQQVYF